MTGGSGLTVTVSVAYLDLTGATPGAAPTWHWNLQTSRSRRCNIGAKTDTARVFSRFFLLVWMAQGPFLKSVKG